MPNIRRKRLIPAVLTVPMFREIFRTEADCKEHLRHMLWGEGMEKFVCPSCQGAHGWWLASRQLAECSECHRQTSVTAGSVFHGTRIPLWKWYWMIHRWSESKQRIAPNTLAKQIGVRYGTAKVMLHKLTRAMRHRGQRSFLHKLLELDSTYLGGEDLGYADQPKRDSEKRVAAARGARVERRQATEPRSTSGSRKHVQLHPALEPWLDDPSAPLDDGLRWLRHPLVFGIFDPRYTKRYNDSLFSMKKLVRQSLDDRDWIGYLCRLTKPYRMAAALYLATYEERLTEKDYWVVARNAWEDAENCWQYGTDFEEFFFPSRFGEGKRHLMMSVGERDTLASLPDPIVIYRGCSKENIYGWSWTIERDKAVWFACRRITKGCSGILLKSCCPKSKVLAYLEEREESEIIVNPAGLKIEKRRITKT